MFLIDKNLLMTHYSNNNDVFFRGYLDTNSKDPKSVAFATMWNESLKAETRNNNSGYGSSYGGTMPVTTCNWGTISNCSPAFSSSYWG